MLRKIFPSRNHSSEITVHRDALEIFHDTIIAGSYTHVIKMLAESPQLINLPGGIDRMTALHTACFSFRPSPTQIINNNHETEMLRIIKLLISAGADINARDKFLRSPLLLAISHSRNLDLIKLLIFEGANLEDTDYKGNTVLHLAVSSQLNCLEISRLLIIDNMLDSLKYRVNVNSQTPYDVIDMKRDIRDRVAVMGLVNPKYSIPEDCEIGGVAECVVYLDSE